MCFSMDLYSHSLWETATPRKEMNATMETMEKMTPVTKKNFSPFNHVLQKSWRYIMCVTRVHNAKTPGEIHVQTHNEQYEVQSTY